MKLFRGIDLVFAAVLFFGGASLVIWPREVNPNIKTFQSNAGGVLERVSEPDSRKWGIVAMVVGTGLAAITIYRGNK